MAINRVSSQALLSRQISGPDEEDIELVDDAPKKEDSEKISPLVDFVAAGLVSSVSKIIVYPMETEVLLVAIGADVARGSGLWHGVTVKALENFWYNGLLWFLKEWVRPPAPDPASPDKRPPATFLAAFAVSTTAILLAHPLQNVTAAMQASLKNVSQKPLGALAMSQQIARSQGLGGFFRGWKFSVALRIGSALTLVVYEFVRRRTSGLLGADLANLLAGLLGRLAEVWSCHPLKTLRSRQQNGQQLLPSLSGGAVLGLWSGVGTQGFADAVKIGIRFLLIERMRTLLQKLLQRSREKKQKALRSASGKSDGAAASPVGEPPREAMGA
jgi:hypothetical protein